MRKNARGRGEDGGEEKVRLFRLNGRLFDRFDEEERREAVAAGGDVDRTRKTKDDDEERDSPMTARRKWDKEQRGANEKTMGTRWKATAMDKVLILTRRVESLEVRGIFGPFSLSLFLGRITQ